MERILLKITPEGEVEIRDDQGEPVERKLAWLLKDLGAVERRGHKHQLDAPERVQQKGG